ncbi:site-specific DNA-methyltransferase [Salmonella enterica subsp. enterica serovar Warnow]|nr:site-specific DNA-methyltransferase [Salmonella enterica subsp. enterica serovar Warnow]EBR0103580.1 site-specific DNA-methyltransferase [Salmonella enterica subsp. enterica serovar Warnow]
MKLNDVVIYEPSDVFVSIEKFRKEYGRCTCAMFDPWYNKGVGGVRDDYVEYTSEILNELATIADHIYFWGFPEIIARFIQLIPPSHNYNSWLTWFYKNNPSVIKGWRSAQMTCLHISTPNAKMYPEHFLNESQLKKQSEGKLRYMPGPSSVIEVPLNIGFIRRNEQTGHPAQKPEGVYNPLIKMVTKPGDIVFDPMCGSGTTGAVCMELNRRSILADINPEYVLITQKRLKAQKDKDSKNQNE